jgi:hypothetical protein
MFCSQCLLDHSKKFSTFYETQTFSALYNSPPGVPILSQLIQSTLPRPISLSLILILYSHLLLSLRCGIFSYPFSRQKMETTNTTLNFKVQVFWGVASCRVINAYRPFEEASVTPCQSARCSTSEDLNPHQHCRENTKSRTDELVSSIHTLTMMQDIPRTAASTATCLQCLNMRSEINKAPTY